MSKYYTAKSQNDVFYNCNHNLPGGFLCCRGPPPRALRSDMITASLASLIPLPGHANSSDTEGCSGHLKSQPLGFLEIEIKPKINSDSVLFFKTCLYHVPFVFVCSLEFLFASIVAQCFLSLNYRCLVILNLHVVKFYQKIVKYSIHDICNKILQMLTPTFAKYLVCFLT